MEIGLLFNKREDIDKNLRIAQLAFVHYNYKNYILLTYYKIAIITKNKELVFLELLEVKNCIHSERCRWWCICISLDLFWHSVSKDI